MYDPDAPELDEDEYFEFESFEKFRRVPKAGTTNPKKSDHQIRSARKAKEKAKQAALEEVNTDE